MEGGVSRRLEAAVRRDFDRGSVEPVLTRLSTLNLPLIETDRGLERIQAAIVLVAGGSYSKFERAASQAETDWRDVLVAAGLANEDWPERLGEQLGERRTS